MADANANALLQLAWASMTEKDIVAKLAAQCRKRGLEWSRGEKGDIREIVADSHPPRGFKKRRLEGVVAEIERQDGIASKRRLNKPLDWSRLRPLGREAVSRTCSLDTRRKRVFDTAVSEKNEYTTCHSFIKWEGHKVFLLGSGYYGGRTLVVLHPDGGKSEISLKGDSARGGTIFDLVLRHLGGKPGLVKQALMSGGSVLPDFCTARTTVRFPGGKELVLPWVKPKGEDGKSLHFCAM